MVGAALDFQTTDLIVLRVAEESLLAPTGCFSVIGNGAEGVTAAQYRTLARIFALGSAIGALGACLATCAVVVATASQFRDADAVDACLGARTLRIGAASRTALAFDTLLRRQTFATCLATRNTDAADASL